MNHPPIARMSILFVSKAIWQEARLAYFHTNDFDLAIERDYRVERKNRSITGAYGWCLLVAHQNRSKFFWKRVPYDMIQHMRRVHLKVGEFQGATQEDIVPPRIRSVSGPERPAFTLLQTVVDEACGILKTCHHLQQLRISIRSTDNEPGSIENLLVPFRELRGVRHTEISIRGAQANRLTSWRLKSSYAKYFSILLSQPRGTPPITYIGDDKASNEGETNIFDTHKDIWNLGQEFNYDNEGSDFGFEDDDEEIDDGDFYDDYEDYDDPLSYHNVWHDPGVDFIWDAHSDA